MLAPSFMGNIGAPLALVEEGECNCDGASAALGDGSNLVFTEVFDDPLDSAVDIPNVLLRGVS